jgi:hypothetical protein
LTDLDVTMTLIIIRAVFVFKMSKASLTFCM